MPSIDLIIMGAIVSTNPEVTADENYPTAVTAAQAKIRSDNFSMPLYAIAIP